MFYSDLLLLDEFRIQVYRMNLDELKILE